MLWIKRIFLFLAVNFLVIFAISLILRIFNIQPYLNSHGIQVTPLLAFCFIWGMAGAFISLMLSKHMAKWLLGVHIIDASTRDPQQQKLLEIVQKLSRDAGLSKTPEVGIFTSRDPNAFATGPSRSSSLVAVSTGLLRKMNTAEIEGVIGHEIAHIANGDMVTMTLLQGVVNAFVMFLARIIAYFIMSGRKSDQESSSGSYLGYTLVVFALEFVFMLFGSMLVAWFSRVREFRADAGGARYAGRHKMIAALEKLHALQEEAREPDRVSEGEPVAVQAFMISSKSRFLRLFATHPPLETRIDRLKRG